MKYGGLKEHSLDSDEMWYSLGPKLCHHVWFTMQHHLTTFLIPHSQEQQYTLVEMETVV
jgi:hypothetical protein